MKVAYSSPFTYNWLTIMPERTTAILANFKKMHEELLDPQLDHSGTKEIPEGMSWIIRNGKTTNCVSDKFSAIHGHGGSCNCGLMFYHRKRFTSH